MKNAKNGNHKKIIVASALMAGAAIGGTTLATNQMVNATSDTSSETQTSEQNKRPELSEEKKAEIKAKLEAMTEEEKQEWLANHKPKKSQESGSEKTSGRSGRPGKPANLTDEEWEEKKAEIKAKLEAMTEEEKQEWLANHKPKNVKNSEQEEPISNSNQAIPAE